MRAVLLVILLPGLALPGNPVAAQGWLARQVKLTVSRAAG